MTIFIDYAAYYDLLYQDKDYSAETRFIVGLIKQYAPQANSVLDLGCGTGVHASLLAEHGFSVHGVDGSKSMIARALMRKGEQSSSTINKQNFFCDDIRTVRLSQKFDVVTALFHVMSYQTANEDLLAVFSTAKLHLHPNGLFIFDCWYGPAVLADRPAVRLKRFENEILHITRFAEPVMYPNKNLVDVNYLLFIKDKNRGTTEEVRETHSMRYLFKPEIEHFGAVHGFTTITTKGWMSEKEPGFDTWSVYFIMKI